VTAGPPALFFVEDFERHPPPVALGGAGFGVLVPMAAWYDTNLINDRR
jgi:hypothetical protein